MTDECDLLLPSLVQVLSENPARIFGLYPRKGCLQEGADTDLVIYDPSVRHTLTGKSLHSKAGYTLFEGRECLGKPWITFQRGRRIFDRTQVAARPGDGKCLRLV
jgi:dihydropyrimidinase